MTAPQVIAVDLGGTSLRATLAGPDGRLGQIRRIRTDARGGPDKVVAQIVELVADVRAAAGSTPILGIGLSSTGPLDPFTGTVFTLPTLDGWNNVPLRDLVAERTGLPVTLENDAISAAVGEWRFGAGRGVQSLAYVTVSTGIGGGVIVDGRIMHGRMGMAGHVGHMTLLPDGPRCGCGNHGCWEALASGTALGRIVRERLAAGAASSMQSITDRPVTAEDVALAARAGDPLGTEILAGEARWLGIGVVSLLHLFSPERVIMGGGVSSALDLMAGGIAAEIQARAMAPFRAVPVVPAALGGDAGLAGAATLAFAAAGTKLP
ncbi:MAG TPA: ROK family protein [Geminicoccus sp.]|jgi:glucokinase|uniref:ROK family protein n=1 Tax=Geminicoccus sp. TaxID=2024832 RepID=UPI002E2FD08B|nr:ROK family protein [Geminicoccus sp.]HEX2525153.1 ROK family protein [Geminicoccus sp.]